MSNVTYLKKLLLIFIITLSFISCENTGDKQTLKEIAITLIANYADGKGPTPTIQNYADAGIIGVNEKNIKELNLFISTLNAEDIDTEAELNAVIDALGISLSSDIFGPIITIHGPNPLTLFLGDTYKKVCATAIDNRDGEVVVYVAGDVDTSKVGTYIVTYSAVDEAGNLTSVDRIIYVKEKPDASTLYTVGGNVSGLVGAVVLQNNNGDNISVTNGTFIFPISLTDTSNYTVTLLTQPTGQTCTVTNGVGTISGINVTDIEVACIQTPPAGFTLNFILPEDDPFLSGLTISFTITNTTNNDFIVYTWTYPILTFPPTTPITQQQFSLPLQLQPGDNYNIQLTLPANPIPAPVPFTCTIPTSTIPTGTMGNADITFVLQCSNLL